MKFIVVWSKKNGERKHFGTANVPDKFFILMDNKKTLKDGMQILIQYAFDENNKLKMADSHAIVKTPLKDIEYEVLGPIQFNRKYPKNEKGYHKYNTELEV